MEKYKPVWALDVTTPAEALRAIAVQRKGFLAACDAGEYVAILYDANKQDLTRQVTVGNALDPWAAEELWILPRMSGETGIEEGVWAAVAIAATEAGASAGVAVALINIGTAMALSAIANIITSHKKNTSPGAQERPESKPSFISNGAVNVTAAGHPHPIVVGHVRDCGSVVLSSNYWVEDIPV
ncbi:hypothetical protein ACH50O_15330 [Methylomonas sp. 2BW1-5-20]|uniref:hypothetical protein n=1 Tax=Methylomonas sp. 2BW1-5-20 TaxID=3376686 RepID=UPI0040512480